jgi:hypothetical protein
MSNTPRQFSYHGLAVRMSARRPNGRVLLQYLQPKSLQPMASWTEAWPHQVHSPGLGIGHIKSLIVALPLVSFVTDGPADPITAAQRPADAAFVAKPEDYWWQRD